MADRCHRLLARHGAYRHFRLYDRGRHSAHRLSRRGEHPVRRKTAIHTVSDGLRRRHRSHSAPRRQSERPGELFGQMPPRRPTRRPGEAMLRADFDQHVQPATAETEVHVRPTNVRGLAKMRRNAECGWTVSWDQFNPQGARARLSTMSAGIAEVLESTDEAVTVGPAPMSGGRKRRIIPRHTTRVWGHWGPKTWRF